MVNGPILRGMANRIGVHQNAHIQPFRTAAEGGAEIQVAAIDLLEADLAVNLTISHGRRTSEIGNAARQAQREAEIFK